MIPDSVPFSPTFFLSKISRERYGKSLSLECCENSDRSFSKRLEQSFSISLNWEERARRHDVSLLLLFFTIKFS